MQKILTRLEEIAFALLPANRKQTCTQFFHVAAIFHKNKILSIGVNGRKTHPMARKYGHRNNQIHAELSTIIKMGLTDLSKYNMAVLRINRRNGLAMSKPCKNCQKLILDTNIKNVFYTDRIGNWTKL